MSEHNDPVVFVDGVHYPIGEDGHANLDRPLRLVAGSSYRDAEDGEPLHSDVHHQQDVEIEPGSEDE